MYHYPYAPLPLCTISRRNVPSIVYIGIMVGLLLRSALNRSRYIVIIVQNMHLGKTFPDLMHSMLKYYFIIIS